MLQVSGISVEGRIELSVTLRRSVGPQSADAANPGRCALQFAGEMMWMCAIDHIVGWVPACGFVDLCNGNPTWLATWQGSIGLDGERKNDRQSRLLSAR